MHYFLLLSFSFLLTAILVPFFVNLGRKYGVVDKPSSRKVHTDPIVKTGGFAVFFGSMIPFILYAPKDSFLLGIFIGSLCIICVGIIDDIVELGYKWKFLGQFIAASITLYISNIRSNIVIRFWSDFRINFSFLSVLLYFFFMVAAINSINLADGLDGLAGGICLLIFCCTAFFAFYSGNYFLIAFCLCIMGGLIGFMRYNTYPAIVFLGDTGSLFLGYSVGICMILLNINNMIISPVIPLYIIGVPVIDTASVIFERLIDKRPVFKADKGHLHHKLLNIGFKHNEAVIIIYSIQLFMIILAWFMRFSSDVVLLGSYLLLIIILLLLIRLFSKREISLPLFNRRVIQKNEKDLSRNNVCRGALYFLLAGMFLFCFAALFAAKSVISKDIGFISLVLIIFILILKKLNSKYMKGVLKLSAYFICLYFISIMYFQSELFFPLYNILFIGLGIFYFLYIIFSVDKIPFFNMDYLLLGIIIFVSLLSKTSPWLIPIKNVIVPSLLTIFIIELLFTKYEEKKLIWPIFLTLTITSTFAFCF